jgi:hypothetical protein
MVSKAMIEEITLPTDLVRACEIPFPVRDRGLDSRIARKGDDRVEMIGHEEGDAAMPDTPFVVIREGAEDGVTDSRAAQMISTLRLAIDGDEEKRSFRNPLWNRVRR